MVGEVSFPIGNLLGLEYDGWTSSESGRTIFGKKVGLETGKNYFWKYRCLKREKQVDYVGVFLISVGGGGIYCW